ncbi:apolipoprotein D-like [Babylonia areolata]|uniref:apolipoprotein D-like n=1 Tax=Babylonia areolata TaxID=304850 RepID=UPI003FD5A8A8
MLRAAVMLCCLAVASGFLLDSVGNVIGSAVNVFLNGGAPRTVAELDDSKYLGRWYQMYASESVALTFERNAVCVTADYGVSPDGRITVLNSDRVETVTGPLDTIHGYATKGNTIGQLTVHLETVPVPAPYWVIKLGPATYGPNGQYQYSVVTDNIKATLFVLARDVQVFREKYEAEVLQFLRDEGFTNALNKPIATLHTPECVYNAVPSS